jgi:hypothetical protein
VVVGRQLGERAVALGQPAQDREEEQGLAEDAR